MPLDLNNLKEKIQTTLEAANTTTADYFLSEDMTKKVAKIMKLNPGRIPVQASWYPFVSIFIDNKQITSQDIAKSQSTAKRRAEVDVKIVGGIWNSTLTRPEDDKSDDNCELLMENIEEVLRANATLSGAATWHMVTGVTYHNRELEEDTHIRVGILNLKVSVFY
jgi:hypothetical protein